MNDVIEGAADSTKLDWDRTNLPMVPAPLVRRRECDLQ